MNSDECHQGGSEIVEEKHLEYQVWRVIAKVSVVDLSWKLGEQQEMLEISSHFEKLLQTEKNSKMGKRMVGNK